MDGIEAELPELEREMRGRIWAEKGLLYAQGFRYAEAADCYGKAWRLSGSRQNCVRYLAALRFSIPEEEYKTFIDEHPELEDPARELAEASKAAEKEWKNGTAGRQSKRMQGASGCRSISGTDRRDLSIITPCRGSVNCGTASGKTMRLLSRKIRT